MTQYINLYQEQFHKKRDWEKIGKLSAFFCFFIGLFLINIYQLESINETEQKIFEARGEYQEKEVIYKKLSSSANQKVKNMALESQVMRIKDLNREKQHALNMLDGDDIGNMSGFSLLLRGLGRQKDKVDDIWLTKLSIKNGGFDMQLSGKHSHPKNLLNFIKELDNEILFKGREFKQVKINKVNSKKNQIKFFLDTKNTSDIVDKEEYQLMIEEFFSILNNFYKDVNKINEI